LVAETEALEIYFGGNWTAINVWPLCVSLLSCPFMAIEAVEPGIVG
jgi:hypothetical protein